MKRFIAILVIAMTCSIISAQEIKENADTSLPSKSIFSVDLGWASDGRTGHGYGVFIKSSSFIGESPVYYGFGSVFGDFITLKENFFETGVFLGYNDFIGDTGLDFDVFIDLLITGGRINKETSSYRSEAPALHTGVALGFPAASDIDGAITFAPVIRPYNSQTGEWDFTRSYFNLSLSIRLKSYMEVKKLPWNYSSAAENKGAIK